VRHDAATNIVIAFDPALIPPSVSLSTGGTLSAPANVTLSATASHPNGITKVEFFEGSNKLGESTAPPYQFVWRNVPAGSFTVTAKATNTNGLTSTSSSIIVGSPATATNIGNISEGNTTDYITDGSGAYINACRFVASADQKLTIIKAKVGPITGKYQCAIYSAVSNAPNTLLRATNELTPATDGLAYVHTHLPSHLPVSRCHRRHRLLARHLEQRSVRPSPCRQRRHHPVRRLSLRYLAQSGEPQRQRRLHLLHVCHRPRQDRLPAVEDQQRPP